MSVLCLSIISLLHVSAYVLPPYLAVSNSGAFCVMTATLLKVKESAFASLFL